MFDFTDKVVIVTGGNKGIGRGIAEGFAEAGAKVAVWGRNENDNSEVVEGIRNAGGKAVAMKVDVTSSEEVENAVNKTLEAFGGRIDVLINNAGATFGSNLVYKMTPEDWRKTIDVDLTSVFIVSQQVVPVMMKQRYGRIINVCSIAGKKICMFAGAAYSAAKAGELGFTRHLAIECGAFGITVNAICPGTTVTTLLQSQWSPEQLDATRRSLPMERLPEPKDHLYAAMVFASDEAGVITGQAIDVDGGQLLNWYDNETYFSKMGEPLTD